MPYCQDCDNHVSDDWVRIFGIDDEVWGCLGCASAINGAGEYAARRTARMLE